MTSRDSQDNPAVFNIRVIKILSDHESPNGCHTQFSYARKLDETGCTHRTI